MAAFVYVIGSKNKPSCRTYVGWTVDPEARIDAHNAGQGAKSTRGRDWQLLYLEKYETRSEAMSREWYLKKDRALRERLRQTLQGDF